MKATVVYLYFSSTDQTNKKRLFWMPHHWPVHYLVLVGGIAVTQVPNQPDEVGFEADDRGVGRAVNLCAEVLRRAEDILAGLSNGVHLLQ